MAAVAIGMLPFREGGGHHIPAQSAFRGDPKYNPKDAPSIPNEVLEEMGGGGARSGAQVHANITRAQQFLYRDFAQTGQKLTWDAMRKIETDALIANGVPFATARATVDAAIAELQAAGVAGPTGIPWAPIP